MRVTVIGPQYPDSFAENLVDALAQMGHEPLAIETAHTFEKNRVLARGMHLARALPTVDTRLERRLVRQALEYRAETVLTVVSLLPNTVDSLRESGAKVALWFPDAVSNLERQLMFIAPYDALFFKEPVLVERGRRILGAPTHYLPEACNPAWHKPPADAELARMAESDPREFDRVVVMAGNVYPYRARLLARLLSARIPLRVYGPPLSRWLRSSPVAACHSGRYVVRAEKAAVFRTAAAVLNPLSPSEIEGVNCRLFEAAGCGAAVLAEQRPELGKLFALNDEVVSFADFDELVDRARWLIDSPDESRTIGDAASVRAHAEHTYQHRLRRVFEVLSS
ncbi:MAG TPA: glycosyltransferase [Acidimicrobiales bacterium]|nr:glycosyltransferase [Acidimicrobiales bacterium]